MSLFFSPFYSVLFVSHLTGMFCLVKRNKTVAFGSSFLPLPPTISQGQKASTEDFLVPPHPAGHPFDDCKMESSEHSLVSPFTTVESQCLALSAHPARIPVVTFGPCHVGCSKGTEAAGSREPWSSGRSPLPRSGPEQCG